MTSPASAQKQKVNAGRGKGLVVVSLAGLLNENDVLNQNEVDTLRNANINLLNDNIVQVPINVAATLCNTEVSAIASINDQGNKSCDATTEGLAGLPSNISG